MPIFLERHDYLKVTATDIAQIHLEDLKIQQEFGCWVLAYWCDIKRKTTFCLIDAPDLKSVKKMHSHIHQSNPKQIIRVEEELIDFFLDSIVNPQLSAEKNTSSYLAFQKPGFYAAMVIKFHCRLPLLKNDYSTRKRLIEKFKVCTQRVVIKNKGVKITAACDTCIYVFDSISRSVKTALQILDDLEVDRNTQDEKKIRVTIGIDGIRNTNNNYEFLEETIAFAGRLCCIAGKDKVLVSSNVMEQFQKIGEELPGQPDNLKSLNQKDEQFFKNVMDIIESKYREDLKIGDFCRKMGKSRSQLYRKIIEVTNRAPIELINEFRLNKSLELINKQNGSNNSQIAYEAGFNSLSYFSRKFKKRYGFLPSEFKKDNRSTKIL